MSTSTTTSSRRPASRDYDTGFPELPRTTTWRHPEANTSPDACISAEDVDPARALHRHRKSFLHHKYKRTTSHGFITTEMEQEYLNSKEALETIDSAVDLNDGRPLSAEDEAARPSKDDSDSIDRAVASLRGNNAPASPSSSQFDHKGDSPRRRSGFFSRIRNHKP
ncbi:hypothetical protein JX265_004238 [Neoarthrinium moseri]|uniref:Uncharacterized protein n=2 Tax=Neoarthrinium moseri TaxID=1658444 RepID=A0A9P9WQL3_9PEZI|nr:hypothetical protein JX266_003810 [Neoarthrinium moseri]KAI1875180.1 hypothetical protein JX265_004238 [Neoarthrinium moseri]